jgi:hypothetical protein
LAVGSALPYHREMGIRTLVEDFTNHLSALIESQAVERARRAVLAAFGPGVPIPGRRRGRPPNASTAAAVPGRAIRKKMPRQFCPVPGCKNPAAPVFGMVCATHKNVAKSKIKKYREARRAGTSHAQPG